MIKKAVILLDMSEGDTLLVGDSFYDAVGTEEANIAFIAAIYGFGFRLIEEVMRY